MANDHSQIPAYPQPVAIGSDPSTHGPCDSWGYGMGGMSLLDWFAGQAFKGMISNPSWDEVGWADMAKQAYEAANELMKVRDEL